MCTTRIAVYTLYVSTYRVVTDWNWQIYRHSVSQF